MFITRVWSSWTRFLQIEDAVLKTENTHIPLWSKKTFKCQKTQIPVNAWCGGRSLLHVSRSDCSRRRRSASAISFSARPSLALRPSACSINGARRHAVRALGRWRVAAAARARSGGLAAALRRHLLVSELAPWRRRGCGARRRVARRRTVLLRRGLARCRGEWVASSLFATSRLGSSCAAVAAYRLGQVRGGRFEPTVWVLCTAETGLDLRALAPRHQKSGGHRLRCPSTSVSSTSKITSVSGGTRPGKPRLP